MRSKALRLGLYTFGHFGVDLLCAVTMFSALFGSERWALGALIYNFCAFALQMPLGLLADLAGRNAAFASVGCALVAISGLLGRFPVALACCAGFGNACFHVGGGKEALDMGGGRASELGVFVSAGALGIFLGAILGKRAALRAAVFAAGALLAAVFAVLGFKTRACACSAPKTPEMRRGAALTLVCVFAVVVLRSWLGMIMRFGWKSGAWAAAFVCCVALGKALGGFFGDRFGAKRTAAVSLGLSAALFTVSHLPLAGLAAVLLFNMSMPITLHEAAKMLPNGGGLAFGGLTFALFLGFLPTFLGLDFGIFQSPLGYAAAALVSLIVLEFGLGREPE